MHKSVKDIYIGQELFKVYRVGEIKSVFEDQEDMKLCYIPKRGFNAGDASNAPPKGTVCVNVVELIDPFKFKDYREGLPEFIEGYLDETYKGNLYSKDERTGSVTCYTLGSVASKQANEDVRFLEEKILQGEELKEEDKEFLKRNLFGRKLRFYRTEADMTQSEVAGRLDVTNSAISSYELGKNFPDPEKLSLLSSIYGVDLYKEISEIFGDGSSKLDVLLQLKEIAKEVTETRNDCSLGVLKLDEGNRKLLKGLIEYFVKELEIVFFDT